MHTYIPWQGTPGAHAVYLLKSLCDERWLKNSSLFPVMQDHPARALYSGVKHTARWKYDKHMAYPPAFSIPLGVGEPIYKRAAPREWKPGLWHMEDDTYLWTPQARKSALRAYEGWYWEEQRYVLKPVYDYLKWWHDGSERGSGARELIKRTYTTMIGLLAHAPERPQAGYVWRPDWRNMIVSEARMRLEAQIAKVAVYDGCLPVAVKVDCLYYEHKVTTLPIGNGIGQFREEPYDPTEEGEIRSSAFNLAL